MAKPRIQLVHKYMYSNEVSLGVSVLDSFLREKGYEVRQHSIEAEPAYVNPLLVSRFPYSKLVCRLSNSLNKIMLDSDLNFPLTLHIDNEISKMSIKKNDIIGFSVHSKFQLIYYLLLAKRIKKKYSVTIVFGGPYIGLFPELIDMKKYCFIDYLVKGRGELPFLRLIGCIEKNEKRISTPKVNYNPEKRMLFSVKEPGLGMQAVPNYEKKRIARIRKKRLFQGHSGLSYQISTGCPNRCGFCMYHMIEKIEFKPVKQVIEELQEISKNTLIRKYRFTDSAINSKRSYLVELCNEMIKERLNFNFSAYATFGIMPEILRLMRRAGFFNLLYGIETGSRRIHKLMDKSHTFDIIQNSLEETASAGINNVICIMIGYPHETDDDVDLTIRFIRKNKKLITRVLLTKFQLLYNSNMYTNPERYGLKIIGMYSRHDPETMKFDEVDGLKWEKYIRQTNKNIKKMMKFLDRYKISFGYDPRFL